MNRAFANKSQDNSIHVPEFTEEAAAWAESIFSAGRKRREADLTADSRDVSHDHAIVQEPDNGSGTGQTAGLNPRRDEAEMSSDDALLGYISNTRGQTSQKYTKIGHIHYLHVSFYVNWENWNPLRKTLAEARHCASYQGPQIITVGKQKAKLLARSPTMGNGRIRMSYCLEIQGIHFLLADRRSASGASPNVMAIVHGTQCLQWTLPALLSFIRKVIGDAGGSIMLEKLSRVDIALDLLDQPIDPFWTAYQQERFITRVKDHRHIGGTDGRTLYFGKTPLTLCLYDKKAELRAKAAERIRDEAWLLNKLWGRESSAVTRVEFRLFRDALKNRGIDSPADFQGKLPDLINYLTKQWFRFTRDEVDRLNPGRVRTLPLWKDVAAGFREWAGAPQGVSLKALPAQRQEPVVIGRQLVGLALTHAARTHNRVLSTTETVDHIVGLLRKELARLNLRREYEKRLPS